MKLLVLASEAIDAGILRQELGEEVEGAEVHVVAPALSSSPLKFWLSDSDEAIAEASEHAAGTERAAEEAGASSVEGDTGESEPLVALQDALVDFPADRIAVFCHADDEQRFREDDLCGDVRERFGVPATLHVLPPTG